MHSPYGFCDRTYIYIQCLSVSVKLNPLTVYRTVLGSARFLCWMSFSVFFGLPIASCSMIDSLILWCLWPLVFVSNNILILAIWRSAISHPKMFLVQGLSEYRIQHGAIGPLHVTSSYSTWIFCRGVSGFVIDCPCGVWCPGLTTCLLYVGPLFGNRLLKQQLGCRFEKMDCKSSFFVFWHMQSYMSWYIICFFSFIFTS